LTAELARQYALAFPSIDFTLVERNPSETTIEQIERREADLAMALADAIYLAFGQERKSDSRSLSGIRAVSALDVSALQLVVRAESDARRLEDLAGRPLHIAFPARESRLITELVLNAAGVDLGVTRPESYSPMVAATKLIAGELDAMLYPLGYPADAVTAATKAGARLVSIEGPSIERLLRRYGFLQLATIPAGVYQGNDQPVRTIGVSTILLCRNDLDQELVYQLTRQFFEVLPVAAASVGGLRYMDLAHASATPIPLHEGAARYYRERQLFR
jgi:TRAP transporter TAXI family solute receptor